MEFDLNKRYCFFFNETCKIPHGSYNEKALSDYIVEFAKAHNFRYMQDEMWNVIVYKDASEGYEDAVPLILQAHIDMVCEKNKDSNHNFETDPLKLYVEDGWLKAEGTTLGADDCKGVAYMLAILEDDNLPHPALECVFTVQEEIGLLGAMNLKKEDLKGHRMVSLDGGGEVSTMLSSAGGCRYDASKKLVWVENEKPTYCLSVRGLMGGHSGGEIHKEKGNANKLVVRIAQEMMNEGADLTLVNYSGGLKDNAIPREADLTFVSDTKLASLLDWAKKSEKAIKEELEFSDAGFYIELKEVVKAAQCLEENCSNDILDFAYLMPNGFMNRSMVIEGLTITSLNLGVVEMKKDEIVYHISIRSAIESGIDNLINVLSKLTKRLGFTYNTNARYPGWNYSEISPMRDIYKKVLMELQGKELQTVAGHGGTECGVFKALIPDIDIISCGAIAKDVHTPGEALDLASFDRTYDILCGIVKNCR